MKSISIKDLFLFIADHKTNLNQYETQFIQDINKLYIDKKKISRKQLALVIKIYDRIKRVNLIKNLR